MYAWIIWYTLIIAFTARYGLQTFRTTRIMFVYETIWVTMMIIITLYMLTFNGFIIGLVLVVHTALFLFIEKTLYKGELYDKLARRVERVMDSSEEERR